VITNCPANSPDLSPIEVLWRIVKKLVRRMKRQTLQEVEGVLPGAWSFIAQDTVDKLYKDSQMRLQLCLVNHRESISTQLRLVTERSALKSFLEANTVHIPWTQEEDERLLGDYQVVGPRWTMLGRTWETRSAAQLKNGWYYALRHRVYGQTDNSMTLSSLFSQFRGSLQIVQFAGEESEVTSKLKANSVIRHHRLDFFTPSRS
jgi:hypothetical protein